MAEVKGLASENQCSSKYFFLLLVLKMMIENAGGRHSCGNS